MDQSQISQIDAFRRAAAGARRFAMSLRAASAATVFFLASAASPAHAARDFGPAGSIRAGAGALHESCGKGTSGALSWPWCFYETEGSANADLIFYFHGYGEAGQANEKTWAKPGFFAEAIRERWRQKGFAAPKVFAVSFGQSWGLAERESRGVAIPFSIFESDVVEQARKLSGGSFARVFAVGESMGGFNAAAFALRTSLPIAKLAALCPLLSPLSPFASFLDVQKFLSANPEASATKVAMVVGFGRMLYADEAEWKARHPLWLARDRRTAFPFTFYSSAGSADQFGIFAGAAEFAKELRRTGTRTTFVPLAQDHCAVDPASAADFLAE